MPFLRKEDYHMTQMDDILKSMDNNPEFAKSIEQAGQALLDSGVQQTTMDSLLVSGDVSTNSNNDNIALYRSLDSDKGSMEGNHIPDSVKREVVQITQMDMIQAEQTDDISPPTHTPSITKENSALER